MSLELVSHGWRARLLAAARGARHVRLVCPFIKEAVAREILEAVSGREIEVITRLNLADLFHGVSDIGALRLLKRHGARIRAVRDLHAKLYIFDDDRAVLTSANLTAAALDRNHEFGGVLTGPEELEECIKYFDGRWQVAGDDLTEDLLLRCENELRKAQATGARVLPKNLVDFGTAAGIPVGTSTTGGVPVEAGILDRYADAPRAFVKFFGTGGDRRPLATPILLEVEKSGSHWACTFSNTKVPRLEDGTVMFMTRTVAGLDFRIYGVGIGLKHVPQRDRANQEEINLRPWKRDWPCYIRVHHAAFVAGTLENGISLHQLMAELGHDAFMSTSRNHAKGKGNTDPKEALRQAAGRELTPIAHQWLLAQLADAFARCGTLSEVELAALDWPGTARINQVDSPG